MRKIKDGEYFRTHDGRIGKIRRFLEKDPYFYNMNYYMTDILYRMPGCYLSYRIYEDMITKHGSSIIDLIEVKDFIEVRIGDEVVSKFLIQDEHILESTRIYVREGSMKIMAVVTHEQFNSIKYEVE